MDVAGLRAYPVFDALRGQGKHGKFTFPDQAKGAAQKAAIGPLHEYTATKDMTLLDTAGHLHPGGLYTDLKITRNGKPRSCSGHAKYFEPAGAVSWDVSMTATKPNWRVAVKPGDKLNVSATYDTRKASWYESMGIMVVFYADGKRPRPRIRSRPRSPGPGS